jgi:hypothetical protein
MPEERPPIDFGAPAGACFGIVPAQVYAQGIFRGRPGQIQGNQHMAEGIKLDGHHRATVKKIFQHPVSHNIQWHDVLSLLEGVADVTEKHDGKFKVKLGPETETLEAPKGSDIDEQMVIDLRRMLKGAGITPESE